MYNFLRQSIKNICLWSLRLRARKTLYGLHILKIRRGEVKRKKMILNLTPGNGWVDTEYLKGYTQKKNRLRQ
jgi:hypothetical protein